MAAEPVSTAPTGGPRVRPCNGCGTPAGALHVGDCGFAQCPRTGRLRSQCGCPNAHGRAGTWDGLLPGEADAIRLGWFAKFTAGVGWTTTDPPPPGTPYSVHCTPDLNRLFVHARWNRKAQRWEPLAPDQ
ncbi:MAG: hypothetical protein HOV68_05385 [Streptomycetaceae bacterium]|nr:hypothetical protein [Streptomycetaceae bacterium]